MEHTLCLECDNCMKENNFYLNFQKKLQLFHTNMKSNNVMKLPSKSQSISQKYP